MVSYVNWLDWIRKNKHMFFFEIITHRASFIVEQHGMLIFLSFFLSFFISFFHKYNGTKYFQHFGNDWCCGVVEILFFLLVVDVLISRFMLRLGERPFVLFYFFSSNISVHIQCRYNELLFCYSHIIGEQSLENQNKKHFGCFIWTWAHFMV